MNEHFKRSLNSGAIAERCAWDILIKSPKNRQVIDVREDNTFREFDVDFLVENTDRQFLWVEVKNDRLCEGTGNIIYELTTSGHIGCFEKTKANYIMYYNYTAKIMYCIDVNKLREYVKNSNLNVVEMGDAATGYLLRINDLKNKKIIVKEWGEIE